MVSQVFNSANIREITYSDYIKIQSNVLKENGDQDKKLITEKTDDVFTSVMTSSVAASPPAASDKLELDSSQLSKPEASAFKTKIPRYRSVDDKTIIIDMKGDTSVKSPNSKHDIKIKMEEDGVKFDFSDYESEDHTIYRFIKVEECCFDEHGVLIKPDAAKKLFQTGLIKEISGVKQYLERYYFGSVFSTFNEKGHPQNTVKKRFYSYETHINTKTSSSEKKKLQHVEYALRRSPQKMECAIIEKLPKETSEQDLRSREDYFQRLYNSRSREGGYNHSDPTQEPLRASVSKQQRKAQSSPYVTRAKKLAITPKKLAFEELEGEAASELSSET